VEDGAELYPDLPAAPVPQQTAAAQLQAGPSAAAAAAACPLVLHSGCPL